jgi:hypothetical protein
MSLLRLLPVEQWIEIERTVHGQTGMNTAVFDAAGARITTFANWANRLCPVIKGHPQGVKYICACANQVITGKAVSACGPVVEECDAGLVKICVPLFEEARFLGTLGGCGLRPGNAPLDVYYLNKITGVPLAELEEMAMATPVLADGAARRMIELAASLIEARTGLRVGEYREERAHGTPC